MSTHAVWHPQGRRIPVVGSAGDAIADAWGAFLRAAGRTAFFQRHMIPVTTRVDRFLYPRTGGRVLSTWPARIPTALLITVGRRSGQPRVFPLFYVRDRSRVYLTTSIRGDWYRNLLANPVASLQLGRTHYHCRARLLTDEERDAVWPRFIDVWPAYEDYRRRTGRAFTFVLERID